MDIAELYHFQANISEHIFYDPSESESKTTDKTPLDHSAQISSVDEVEVKVPKTVGQEKTIENQNPPQINHRDGETSLTQTDNGVQILQPTSEKSSIISEEKENVSLKPDNTTSDQCNPTVSETCSQPSSDQLKSTSCSTQVAVNPECEESKEGRSSIPRGGDTSATSGQNSSVRTDHRGSTGGSVRSSRVKRKLDMEFAKFSPVSSNSNSPAKGQPQTENAKTNTKSVITPRTPSGRPTTRGSSKKKDKSPVKPAVPVSDAESSKESNVSADGKEKSLDVKKVNAITKASTKCSASKRGQKRKTERPLDDRGPIAGPSKVTTRASKRKKLEEQVVDTNKPEVDESRKEAKFISNLRSSVNALVSSDTRNLELLNHLPCCYEESGEPPKVLTIMRQIVESYVLNATNEPAGLVTRSIFQFSL